MIREMGTGRQWGRFESSGERKCGEGADLVIVLGAESGTEPHGTNTDTFGGKMLRQIS